MFDNLLGGNDDPPDDDTGGETDGLFDDPADGDLAASGDPLDGGDGLMGGDESTLDGRDDGGATNGELSNRMDGIEDEVASLSSSVETVRSENEQIRDAVDAIEENVRKLLEIYEMVTRGVNPFVDENGPGSVGAGSGTDGSFGLFGEDSPPEETPAADGLEDETGEEDPDSNETEPAAEDDDVDPEDEVEEDGQSFEEIKSKYESGEENGEVDGDVDVDEDENEIGTGDAPDGDPVGAAAEGDSSEVPTEGSEEARGSSPSTDANGAAAGKPYLEELPAGYSADIVVLDWLEFLVDEAGVDGAAGTIAYYEAIEWLSASAAESLQTYLQGFGEEIETDPEPRSWLTIDHHDASLRFIGRLADPSTDALAFDPAIDRSPRGRTAASAASAPAAEPAGPAHAGRGPGRGRGRRREPSSNGQGEREVESDGGRPIQGDADPDEMADERTEEQGSPGGRSGRNDSDEQPPRSFAGEAGYGGFYWNRQQR